MASKLLAIGSAPSSKGSHDTLSPQDGESPEGTTRPPSPLCISSTVTGQGRVGSRFWVGSVGTRRGALAQSAACLGLSLSLLLLLSLDSSHTDRIKSAPHTRLGAHLQSILQSSPELWAPILMHHADASPGKAALDCQLAPSTRQSAHPPPPAGGQPEQEGRTEQACGRALLPRQSVRPGKQPPDLQGEQRRGPAWPREGGALGAGRKDAVFPFPTSPPVSWATRIRGGL